MKNVHVGSHEDSREDLDSSQGFQVCNRCDYEEEDRYELDGHLWYEHEEDENGDVFCKFCDEKFANIQNMMMHKKINLREKIDFCQTPETMKVLSVIFVNKHLIQNLISCKILEEFIIQKW